MGNCTLKQTKVQKSPQKANLQIPNIGTLKFNTELCNIKLTYPSKSCYLKIDIGGFQKCDTPKHYNYEGKHGWKRSLTVQMEVNEEQLRDKQLIFQVYEDEKELALLKISLYDIINGPQLFDYQIGKGRIQFIMIMSQILQIEINPQDLICTMNQCIQDRAYIFSLRLMTRKMQFQSENSERFINPQYIRGRNASFQILQDELYKIQWLDVEQMPKLIVELPINEISSSSLQICLWSINKLNDEFHSPTRKSMKSIKFDNNDAIDHELFAESNVALNYLVSGNEDHQFDYTLSKTQVTKGLWLRGCKVGQMSSNFTIKIPFYLKQQMIGLRSEKGCSYGTGIVLNQSVKEISEIVSIFEKLSIIMSKLSNTTQTPKQQLIIESQTIAQQLLIAVSKSDKESQLKQFYYKSYDDLMRGQETFIKLAENLINFADKVDETLSEIYYEILTIVCTRGELSLNQMGYFDECKDLNKKQLAFKQQICIHFQSFLYNTLNIILQKICQKVMSPKEKIFVEKFAVSSFFKIPEFRQAFINSLENVNDPPLIEWRGTDYQLSDPETFEQEQITVLFDWQSYFYNYIPNNNVNFNTVTLTSDDGWRRLIAKRSTSFFFFIQTFCQHIQQKLQKEIIPWKDIPGYRKLLKALLCELKIRDIYPDVLINAITSIVSNGGPLNVIIMILYNKTNIFKSDQTVQTMDLISQCLQQCQNIPTNFDYPFFLNGLRIAIFQSQNAYVISKTLYLIYQNYLLFPLEFKKAIVDMLFETESYELFLHWSKTVRSVYYSILIYRINHLHRNTKVQISDESQFEKQYFQISKPKRLQSYFENRKEQTQLISDFIYLKFTRFMMNIEQAYIKYKQKLIEIPNNSLIERMKKKIQERNSDIISNLIISQEEIQKEKNENIDKEKIMKKIIVERKNEFRTPSKKKTIVFSDSNLRYISQSINEYHDMMKQYTKWRQQNAALIQTQKSSDDDQKGQFNSYTVPQIKLLQRYDMKEGRQE